MFKFNFSDQNKDGNVASSKNDIKSKWIKSEQIFHGDENNMLMKDVFKNCLETILDCKEFNIKYFSCIDVLNILRTSEDDTTAQLSVLDADRSHSDLTPAVYEGGLKIWECTYDLINYIIEHEITLDKKNILDLGCGSGLIGILCLLKGSICTFQDYNLEVLQYITIANIRLNNEDYLQRSKFYSGDWQSFTELYATNDTNKFDYIFTSETIYNTENYDKLHNTFERLLKRNGEIYLAAKSYYFGVGGGISLFQDYLKSRNIFKYSSCWKCTNGVNREILKIIFI